jgi:hypothetical protein
MDVKDLLFPVLLVVGESPDESDVELVAVFSCLAAAVLDPPEHDDVVNDVLQHVELDDLPAMLFPCPTNRSGCVLVCATQISTQSQHTGGSAYTVACIHLISLEKRFYRPSEAHMSSEQAASGHLW